MLTSKITNKVLFIAYQPNDYSATARVIVRHGRRRGIWNTPATQVAAEQSLVFAIYVFIIQQSVKRMIGHSAASGVRIRW